MGSGFWTGLTYLVKIKATSAEAGDQCENYMWSLMMYFSTTYFLSLCSPLPDENRELCEECVCNEQQQNTKTACWVIKHFFAGIRFVLPPPDTHTVLYEWVFERHSLLIYFSFLSLVLGDRIQPKTELCHSPIFSDVIFWMITHSKQNTGGWLAS